MYCMCWWHNSHSNLNNTNKKIRHIGLKFIQIKAAEWSDTYTAERKRVSVCFGSLVLDICQRVTESISHKIWTATQFTVKWDCFFLSEYQVSNSDPVTKKYICSCLTILVFPHTFTFRVFCTNKRCSYLPWLRSSVFMLGCCLSCLWSIPQLMAAVCFGTANPLSHLTQLFGQQE